MPKLPTAESLGGRPVPQVRGNIAPLQLETPNLSAESRAATDFSQAITGLGETIDKLALREKKQLDETRKREAVTNYLKSQLDLEDGKDGFANVLGGDAVKRPLVDEYREKRVAARDEIRKGLGNKEQQMAFDAEADIADRQFDSRLYRHVSAQSRAYSNVVYEGSQETNVSMAAKNWSISGEIDMAILRSDVNVDHKARNDGLDPARPADKEIIDTLKSINRSKIHTAVMETMLMQGKDKAASAYFNQIEKDLTPEARITLGHKIEASTVENEAMRGVDQVWEAVGPKSLNDPVRLDLMEGWIRNQYKDDPRQIKSAVQELRARAGAHNDAQREMTDSNKAKVLGAYAQGADLKTIMQTPEYQALDGEDQLRVKEYITANGYSEQQRARAQAAYEDGEKARLGFQRYWELSNPKVLHTMSEAQILSLEPELGRTLVSNLMESRRKLDKPSAVLAATIDGDMFNTLAAEAGLKPYDKNIPPDQKEYLGRLKNRVEAVIDQAQQRKQGPLTREEKEKLMHQEIDRKVLIDEWGRDPKLPAASIKPEQREKVYVPIQEIPSDWAKGAINYMRSSGAVPLEWSDTKIKERFADRLQRAYGWSITGGDSASGKRILEGK